MQTEPTTTNPLLDIKCEHCQDMGFVVKGVPFGHPDFGRAFTCPVCGGPPEVKIRQQRKLEDVFGEWWMFKSPKLTQYDMQDFAELDRRLMQGKDVAIRALMDWVKGDALTYEAYNLPRLVVGDTSTRSVTLWGVPGVGKTALLSAAFMVAVEIMGVGLPIEYNALMQCFLRRIDGGGDVSEAVTLAARVPMLFLDDLGNTFVRQETEGRARWLFEIINYRYNHKLPTLITTNLDYWALADQFDRKLAERIIEMSLWVEVGGPSLRVQY